MLLLAALAIACSSQPEQEAVDLGDPEIGRTRLAADELPPVPPYPQSRNGRLVTQSAGDHEIQGEWSAQAGLCDDAGIMEIYAGPPGYSTALFIRMPEGDRIGEYPIAAAATPFPSAPAALVAVQIFEDPDAYGFQGYHGLLELSEWGDEVSGRFASTLREVSIDVLTHYVGTFEGIPVKPLPQAYCDALRDSTLAPHPTESSEPSSDER